MTTAFAIEDVRREVKILRALSGDLCCFRLCEGGELLDRILSRGGKTSFYASKEDSSQLKAIDFGLSDYVRADERLNDIVGSAYYVAPEVLHRSYSTEANKTSEKALGLFSPDELIGYLLFQTNELV
ncbi:CDPK-related kinase 5 [Raphanus sativus]|nr:CDPK-related kinase 5 [Raphanus sativus]